MQKRYIDCDGVILDTERGLFEKFHNETSDHSEVSKINFLQNLNWLEWINNAGDINDAIYILKNNNPNNADILTTVHSLKEAEAKIRYFREMGVHNNIIIVPYNYQKCDIVNPFNNLLIDNACKRNLEPWEKRGGIPVLFTLEKKDICNNYKYLTISSLVNVFDNSLEIEAKGKILKKCK